MFCFLVCMRIVAARSNNESQWELLSWRKTSFYTVRSLIAPVKWGSTLGSDRKWRHDMGPFCLYVLRNSSMALLRSPVAAVIWSNLAIVSGDRSPFGVEKQGSVSDELITDGDRERPRCIIIGFSLDTDFGEARIFWADIGAVIDVGEWGGVYIVIAFREVTRLAWAFGLIWSRKLTVNDSAAFNKRKSARAAIRSRCSTMVAWFFFWEKRCFVPVTNLVVQNAILAKDTRFSIFVFDWSRKKIGALWWRRKEQFKEEKRHNVLSFEKILRKLWRRKPINPLFDYNR